MHVVLDFVASLVFQRVASVEEFADVSPNIVIEREFPTRMVIEESGQI